MTKNEKRDPRIDPRRGDIVRGHGSRGRERTIHTEYISGRFGWATESPLASGMVTLNGWRRWAKDGEVILVSAS